MTLLERIGLGLLHQFDPERAHHLAIMALRTGLTPAPGPVTSSRLACTLAGMSLPNPVGLAAGFDKNAVAVAALSRAGFGFLEVGAATPRPQPGNPRPRVFRLQQDQAVINRFGFNNDGAAVIAARLAQRPSSVPVGLNLGANKDSVDRAADFAQVLQTCGQHVDFATVNVSSPNTERLRDLQGKAALSGLLEGVMAVQGQLPKPIPIFLKIAPDLSDADLADVAEVAVDARLSGIIATNTTLDRTGLHGPHAAQAGGLSGAPLFNRATQVLARLSRDCGPDMPLIGVGGVADANQAYAKIQAGASAVQIYTAMIYHGLSVAVDIAQGLDRLLERDGFTSVRDAIGTDREHWLGAKP